MRSGYRLRMRKRKIEIEVDIDLLEEAVQRFHLGDGREAINLALRNLLNEGEDSEADSEYDEFSDLSAWQPRRAGDPG